MAQPIVVKSGEHDGFTRLVLTLPSADTEYELRGVDTTWQVIIPGHTNSFDTSSVFQRIPRTRLAALGVSGAEGLDLGLGCDCDVKAFRHAGTHLVIDISERSGEAPRSKELAGFVLGARVDPPASLRFQFQSQTAVPTVADTAERTKDVAMADRVSQVGFQEKMERQLRVSEVQKIVLDGLARAGTSGLLRVKPTVATESKSLKNDIAPPHPSTVEPDDEIPVRHRPVFPNVKVENSVDRALREQVARMQVPDTTCIDPDLVDIAKWSDGRSLARQVAALNAELTGEFDHLNDAVALRLSKTYLFFGLGQEALAALNLVPASRETAILTELATVLEGRNEATPILTGQARCGDGADIWFALAVDQWPEYARPAADSILRGFSRLPDHLRTYLGPRLADRFRANGDPETSRSILRIAMRDGSEPTPEMQLSSVVANIDAHHAGDKLQSLVTSDQSVSPKALMHLIENHVRSKKPLGADLAELAGAYAVEFQKTEMGPELRKSHALARAASGQFRQAFFVVRDIEARDGSVAARQVRDRIAFLMGQHADEFELLSLAVSEGLLHPNVLSDVTANLVAKRILGAGFAKAAWPLVSGPAAAHVMRERRIIRAQVRLALEEPDQALVDLLGLSGEDADILRRMARKKLTGSDNAPRTWPDENRPQNGAEEFADIGDGSDQPSLQLLRALVDNSGIFRKDAAKAIEAAKASGG
ncbi:hypothetical protein [Shimia biformata]|uniref:hypothetical protein n=1 Tax=Shimia biformata TaxID=1294299 RepID=UPI001951A4CF|nr:hypothetical protein [Shimia biformata]